MEADRIEAHLKRARLAHARAKGARLAARLAAARAAELRLQSDRQLEWSLQRRIGGAHAQRQGDSA